MGRVAGDWNSVINSSQTLNADDNIIRNVDWSRKAQVFAKAA